MKRLYVLVRKDLPPAYQAVQAGHAVAEWLVRGSGCYREGDGYRYWENDTLVYLHVADEAELLAWHERLEEARTSCRLFREEDLGGQATALAVGGDAKPLVRGLKLMA